MMKNKAELRKIATNIKGLDKLLYDGIDMSSKHTIIVIKGDDMTDRTLLGFQMLYGIAQSLSKLDGYSISPTSTFISMAKNKEYLDDLFLDICITSAIQRMTELYNSGKLGLGYGNTFASTFFETNSIECRKYPKNNSEQMPHENLPMLVDEMICKEAIYYNNRTNALHFNDIRGRKTNEKNILYKRKKDAIHGYFSNKNGLENIASEEIKKLKAIGQRITFPFLDTVVQEKTNFDSVADHLATELNALVALDVTQDFDSLQKSISLNKIFKTVKKNDNIKLFIVVIPENMEILDYQADLFIEMKTRQTHNYLLKYLSITQDCKQTSNLGWHQYKRRDYGVEVYPSIHSYFLMRRYLQRALVYTHSDVLTDTYQQYLNKHGIWDKTETSYTDYNVTSMQNAKDYFQALYKNQKINLSSVDILEKILLSEPTRESILADSDPSLRQLNNFRGGVTTIIGGANTYKRFLTFGSLFSSSLNQEHTLLLLLNKDDETIKRRLTCPARSRKCPLNEECEKCYSYIHFMNICMGMITPDEFLYFLEKQIDVPLKDGKRFKRIVIDDLQILDFCFPLLHENSSLFLSALVALCRDRDIALYMMCDKNCSSANSIRALADNVICTDRDEKDGKLKLYIERFAGYLQTPSKIYCGKVRNVMELFECYKKRNDRNQDISYYSLNSMQIEDKPVTSMNKYWEE